MRHLPLTLEIAEISKRVIHFEKPEQAIAHPARFVAYAMTYGTYKDIAVIRRYYSEDDLRTALTQAPPGIFDGPFLGVLEPQSRPLSDASHAPARTS